eukprot:SAG31_NODE_17802_length_657_cov_1.086022_1_plen_23_part_10
MGCAPPRAGAQLFDAFGPERWDV